jgi:anti-sigma factor RsiW
MTSHLSHLTLSTLADGELSAEELASANEHLAGCAACTSQALSEILLKSATARAGRRYAPPPELQQRLAKMASRPEPKTSTSGGHVTAAVSVSMWSLRSLGWLAAAAVLLVAVSIGLLQYRAANSRRASDTYAALVTEVCDQHIATLAAGPAPEVISTDRHTVKPWFQGKLPFSFNLPEDLPANTTLDGANLSYLGNQPVAQLLYSIGKHRVSVFVRERSTSSGAKPLQAEHSGFHVAGFDTDDLEGIAVSDVDPVRLHELVAAIRQAQSGASSR